MVSATLLASIGGVKSPLDLLKLPLLREDDNAWEKWFALSGHTVPPGIARGPLLDTRQIMGRAAIEGQGVALLVPEFFTDEIAAGRLVQPFPQLLFSPLHYYLAYAKSRQHVPKIQAFRSWILGELAADRRSNDLSHTPWALQRGA
jgi:LysR family glycine cleavage system transcriptional activator